MNALLAIPEARLAVLFVLGACVGSLVNLGVYRLAWHPRPIGPWAIRHADAPPRRAADRLPIFGWLGLRREAALHGTGFWVRPMLLEVLAGVGFAALYFWEIERQGLLPAAMTGPLPPGSMAVLHAQYGAHLLLIALMLVASMIDLDEKIIPDAVTIPGTLLGLTLAAAWPWSMLPEVSGGNVPLDFLRLTSPNPWPDGLDGCPQATSLLVGLGCWWTWCVALMPRMWYTYYGWRKAIAFLFAKLAREPSTYRILVMGLLGSAAIVAVWLFGAQRWEGLLSSLVGMAAAGGIVWMIRVIGTAALKKEAMGFGDVTLMAMIGTFLGWQTCLVVFFIAPFAGLVMGVAQMILFRDAEIPYGPFLCLAAVVTIVYWAAVWERLYLIFGLGLLVPLIVLCCMALMAVMLGTWRLIREAFR